MWTAVCEIEYWNSAEDREEKEYCIITQGNSFTDVMRTLEDYYAEDLISAKINSIEGPLLVINEELANKFISEGV
jgi:hypothetical protein